MSSPTLYNILTLTYQMLILSSMDKTSALLSFFFFFLLFFKSVGDIFKFEEIKSLCETKNISSLYTTDATDSIYLCRVSVMRESFEERHRYYVHKRCSRYECIQTYTITHELAHMNKDGPKTPC